MGLWKHSFLLLFFVTSVSCWGISMDLGNVTLDKDIRVNETLRIQCSLCNTSILIKNKAYVVSSENLILKFETEYLQDLKTLDELSIEYVVENAQEEDTGTYSCYVTIPELNTNVLVSSTYMAVGYPPQPVTNFSCISYEYTNLTCSWIKPHNPVKTRYTLFDYLHINLKRACPEVLNETSCRWTLDTKPQYRVQPDKIYFLIMGENNLGKSKQYAIEEHFKIIKPGIPTNVMIKDVTETSLTVHWSPPKYMGYQFIPGLEYSVLYQPISPVLGALQEIRNFSHGEGMVLIENLVPHTEYHFSIRCRSSEVDNDNFWSPSATAVEKTFPDSMPNNIMNIFKYCSSVFINLKNLNISVLYMPFHHIYGVEGHAN